MFYPVFSTIFRRKPGRKPGSAPGKRMTIHGLLEGAYSVRRLNKAKIKPIFQI